ncbi:hypothetical protein CspeluHIS016_0402630 [Cutaneotrichosporon spelunceum]|uniref:Uncharacterized protein n=1 Tax=Cutaneotrichosporon spelunceum TaxID=1672016 RepID=A0AAD3YD14_9TREE|nr:hypothetical protein CspeluHIS016_0402630 [Cutaneotrichosporon spelunceum]
MLLTALFTAALAAISVQAADAGLPLMNVTAAGSRITVPNADTTIPANGTLYINWKWEETTTPNLMVLLINSNKTIFHPAGNTPSGTSGLAGKGLYDTKERVLANKTTVSFGPIDPPGDIAIKAGDGYQVVLAWENKGDDAATNPYNFLVSSNFTIGPKGPQELPEGVEPWNAPPASGAARAGVPAAIALLAVGVAALA